MGYSIGVDLGGTNIAVGVVDETYHIVAKHSVPTLAKRPYAEIVADMAAAIHTTLEEAGVTLEECTGIGIGSPGICNSKTGVVVYSNNIRWDNVPLAQELQKHIDLPVYLSNDANCAALGEVLAGVAKNYRNAVLITLGTGVGGGIILDGKIYDGQYSAGGEIGHTMLILDGEPCTCGRNGCFEAYASATGLIRQTLAAAQADPLSLLNEQKDISARTAFICARMGDATALDVVKNYVKYLSEGIVDLVNIFRPEVIILGGGVCNEGDYLLDPVNAYVSAHCFGGDKTPPPPVVKAQLGSDAGIIGAGGVLATERSFANVSTTDDQVAAAHSC